MRMTDAPLSSWRSSASQTPDGVVSGAMWMSVVAGLLRQAYAESAPAAARIARERTAEHNSRVMANLSIPAPIEPEKSPWIHDRSQRPDAPARNRMALVRQWWGFALGLALAVGLTATLFSLRDSWHNHREWLVTVIPVLVIAGIGLGHLIARQKLLALAVPGGFLFMALLFMVFDIVADNDGSSMGTRDAFSILGGIALGGAAISLSIALLWVEIRNPTKAPTPEL